MNNFTQIFTAISGKTFNKFVASIGLMVALLVGNVSFGQTSYLGLNGGFEGTATIVNGTTNSTPVATNWTKSTATATIANETGTVRSGSNSMKVTSTSSTLCRVFSPLMTVSASTTKWQVQYYRNSTSTTNTVQAQPGNYRGGTEQASGVYAGVTAANTWEKVTYSPTTTTSATTAAAHMLVKMLGTGGSTFYDDFVLYESATIDATAPNSPGSITFSGQTTSSIGLSWGAASGGVDGGGYIVVRGTTDPTTAPNVNGIYASGNTIAAGMTVVYQGTGTSFTDTGLSSSTTYYYRVYTFDKAYNYSTASTGSSATISSAITSAGSGDWSNTATWVGGVVPTSADNALILSGHTVLMNSGTYATRNSGTTTTVDAGGTLATNQTYVNNGTTTINGSFRLDSGGWVSDAGGTNSLVYGTNGTLIFNTAYGANNGNYWPTTNGPVNVTVTSGSNLNLGFSRTVTGTFLTAAGITLSSSTLTLNGICQLDNGGYFNNSPTYGASSTLVYNTSYGVFNEWTGNGAAGTGIPANVRVKSGTLTLTTTDRGIPGNITIDATCALVLNGTSGDLYIGGNWNNSGTFTSSGRAVFFNGAANQTITNASGETFNYLINNKSAGNLILANNVTVNASSGSALQILNAGAIDLNGQTLTLANNGGNLQVTGGARLITSSVVGGILSVTGTKTVFSTSSGTLILGSNVTTSLANGIDFGASLTTIQGKLQVNAGGYVISNAPIYSNTSTLEYVGFTGGYGVNNEWTGNATTAGLGTPQNVLLTSTVLNMPGSARSLAGNLTIGTGSTLNLNGSIGADFNIGGNWINSGVFNPNSRQVTFRGSLAQTLTGATTFDYLKMDNSAGLTLNNSVDNTFTLDLTSGNITLGTNNLTIGSAGTIINGSATSYVKTNGTGQLKRTVGASATLFPAGNSTYNPITFNNSGTSDQYGVRVLDGAITTGVNNTKTVSRSWITTENTAGGSNLSVVAQYNTGEENTNFIAGTNPRIGFYNGSIWTEVVATAAGSNPFTYSSNTNVSPSDLTSGTQYFAIGKDNAFLSLATQFAITSITPTSPGAGYPFSVTIQSQDAYNAPTNVITNTSFTLSTNGNAGVIGGTITGTILAGTNSIVVSGVTLATAGTGVTLTATQTSGDPLTAGTSATFSVQAAASQLAFVGVPATGNAGVNLTSFTVEARRPDNSVDTFYTGNITISKATPATGTLSGTVTVAAVAGVATFSNAQFDIPNTYTLTATSGSLTAATSGNVVVTLVPVSIFANPITGSSPGNTSPYTTGQTYDANITVSGVVRGSGISGATGNDRYTNTNWTLSTSIDTSDYIELSLIPNLGYSINFENFNFTNQRSGSGPSNFAVRSSLNNFSTDLGVYSNTATNIANNETLSLSGVTFDDIPSTITFRIYGYSATNAGGTGSLNDFDFRGNVTCIQPIAYNVTGGGVGCANTGAVIGLSGSQVGISYQLKDGATNVGSPVAGTGAAISFPGQTTLSTYTVEATNVACSLTLAMNGSATVTGLNPIPTLATITATPACENTPSSVTLTGLLPNTAGSFFYTNSMTGATQYPVSGTSDSSGNFSFNTPNLPLAANGATITIVSGMVTATGCTTTFTGKSVNVVVDALPTASIVSNNGPAVCSGSTITFNVSGTSGATITYNLNGGSNTTATLTGGVATITVTGATASQTLNLVSVANGACTVTIGTNSTVLIESTTWDGTAWSNGTPTSTKSVIFTGNYSVTGNLDACSITVSNSAVVSVASGYDVNLNGALTVSSGSFTLNNNANLLQADATAVNTGNIIVKRNSNPLIRLDYTLWGSPVTGQNLFAFSPLTSVSPTVRFYTYNTSTNVYNSVANYNTTDFATGKGYLIRLPFNHPTAPAVWAGSFTGVPNNGTKTITLDNIDASHQFNAVGNPYPSPISIAQFANDNSNNIEPTLYFWRKTNNSSSPSYCTWNTASATFGDNGEAYTNDPSGVIQTGQGFIVEAKDGMTSLEFNNGQRIGDNAGQFFRNGNAATPTTNEAHRIWVNLTGASNEFSQAVVGYFTNATQGADDFDSKFFNDGAVALSTIIGSTEYVIQGRSVPFVASDVVPLNYRVTTAGTYTFTIDHADGLFAAGTQDVYIKDNLYNTYNNLNTAPYSFTTEAGTFADRFELVYQNTLSADANAFTANSIKVIHQQNEVVVNSGNALIANVKVYDVRGRLLAEKKDINASETKLNVGTTNQVLLVQVTTTEGVKATKKVIN